MEIKEVALVSAGSLVMPWVRSPNYNQIWKKHPEPLPAVSALSLSYPHLKLSTRCCMHVVAGFSANIHEPPTPEHAHLVCNSHVRTLLLLLPFRTVLYSPLSEEY